MKKNSFPFQTDKILKDSLHMFGSQKNKSTNNVIAYIAPKNKTMSHSMTLNNRISCIVGISIFGFKTYWEQVFNLMDKKTTQTLTDFLQAETLNSEKKKTYYQRYYVKQLRAFHKQAMIKQQVYDNMLARQSEWTIVQEYCSKQVSSTLNRHKNSPRTINRKNGT